MKRYIKASKPSYLDRLRELKKNAEEFGEFPEGTVIEINNARKCLDIILPDGSGWQGYPVEGDPIDSFGYRYKYVGENKGDYVRIKYPRTRKTWKDEAEWKDVIKFKGSKPYV